MSKHGNTYLGMLSIVASKDGDSPEERSVNANTAEAQPPHPRHAHLGKYQLHRHHQPQVLRLELRRVSDLQTGEDG